MAYKVPAEVGDADADTGRAEGGNEHVAGIGAQVEFPRCASPGGGPEALVGDEAAVDQLGNALGHDGPAMPGNSLQPGPGPGLAGADQVEHGDE